MGDERVAKLEDANQTMTVVKKDECRFENKNELVQGDEELSMEPSKQPAGVQERGGASESDLCPGFLVNTVNRSVVQLHTTAGNKDLSRNSSETLQEAKENRENTGKVQSQKSQSFLPQHMSGHEASGNSQVAAQPPVCDDDDENILRRARDEGRVNVVFPGNVTHDAGFRFVCELLKFVLYQRQQLPMTYDQMVFTQKQQLASTQMDDGAVWKSAKPSGHSRWHHCQRTLRELDEVLGHLEVLFSLSNVPRVLFMLGKSRILPTELYEINLEALVHGGSDRSLRTSACLRLMFRTLFEADLLSDVKPVRLMGTTVLALAHRDCGVEWFKPKIDFRIPTRVKRQVIALASAASGSGHRKDIKDWDDYIWFQAPVIVKGFCK